MGGLMEMLSASVFKKFVAENGRSRTCGHTPTPGSQGRAPRTRKPGSQGRAGAAPVLGGACVWQQG